MICEKTGWSLEYLSSLSLDSLRLLIEAWSRLASGETKAKPASAEEVKQVQALLRGIS